MEEDALLAAVARIEKALARIEVASRQTNDLRDRHARLKASVSQSLDELDKLIGGGPA